MEYLVLADVHANAAALRAILETEQSWDHVLFLGDAVDAGPDPNAVVSMLADLPGHFLMGNHDRQVLELDPTRTPTSPGEAWRRWTRRTLTDEHLAFLRDLPDSRAIKVGSRSVRLHHGDFPRSWNGAGWNGRLWPDAPTAVLRRAATHFDETCILHGHTHVQFRTRYGETWLWNPGSVGQHRLGQVLACYGILRDGEFSLHGVEYDAERTRERLARLPLDESYLEARERVYTEGRLPDDAGIRDLSSLADAGYR